MSNSPAQYLKHGKALCGKVFGAFVETFNWHTDFCRNLKGDGDIGEGRIKVDMSDSSHPVIRFDGRAAGAGAEADGGDEAEDNSTFAIASISGHSVTLKNTFLMCGGILRPMSVGSKNMSESKPILVASISVGDDISGDALISLSDISELIDWQRQPETQYRIPLYKFKFESVYGETEKKMSVEIDFRNAPKVQVFEDI